MKMANYDDWIESHTNLADHPKVHNLSRTLSVRYTDAIGTLHLLWWYSMRFAWRDGNLAKHGCDAIEGACKWSGKRGALVKALQDTGWLDELKVHDWLDFAGRLVNDRLRYERTNASRTHHVRNTSVKRTSHVANLTLPDLTLPTTTPPLPPKVGNVKIMEWFEKTWKAYPAESRVGKKAAFRHYQKSVKNLEDAKRVAGALDRYLKSKRVTEGYVQNASTWFNNWEDWKDDDERRSSPSIASYEHQEGGRQPHTRSGGFIKAERIPFGSTDSKTIKDQHTDRSYRGRSLGDGEPVDGVQSENSMEAAAD